MKNFGLLVLVFVLLSLGKHKSTCETYNINEKLNLPFGTIVKIKAKVINDDELNFKAAENKMLLKVISVDGKKMVNDVTMFFENETYSYSDSSFVILDDNLGKSMDDVDYEHKRGFVNAVIGEVYNLYVYETGSFIGIPDKHFNYLPSKSGVGFHFRNKLKVLGVIQ